MSRYYSVLVITVVVINGLHCTYLFCVEILAIMIREDGEIKGIWIK